MRALIQRVREASVTVDGKVVSQIGPGLVVLLGIGHTDTEATAKKLAEKISHLRIFPDASSKFNLSALDVSAEVLVISQFTLYADTKKGHRPSFTEAAPAGLAKHLVQRVSEFLQETGLRVASGRFQASMLVKILNDGPVTIMLEV
ncbi:MAG: D-aminoacyl-tRNA deacylase [Chloroflexi bacterium]|nr:D-aminoacyl-tRNA deacylase [Chloroflexota bacterium]MCL5076385.1 D-aminoacyl-tRNA deacylase [Chloroflexota bacterium]